MRLLLTIALVPTLAGAANAAGVASVSVAASEDRSLPFACDWGYDWEERCYGDDSERLGVGGVDDSVWRAALRFPLDSLPPGAVVITAELSLSYDGTCVAPRRTTRMCDGRGFELEARPIYTPRWLAEREVEFGPVDALAFVEPLETSGSVVWDLTDLVAEWVSGARRNDGVLLQLAEEGVDSTGPSFPSSSYADSELRPRLTIWYLRE
jgi:hypothetical protein